MIINRPGAEFIHNGVTYVIGAPIYANDQSDYEGLYGRITEIRDGEDKETENDTPDLYCEFDPPGMPKDIANLEEIFSDLYNEPRTLDEIILDLVIMAPEMVVPLPQKADSRTLTVYKVLESWAISSEEGQSEALFTDPAIAGYTFHSLLTDAMNSDWMAQWEADAAFTVEEQDGAYRCFLDGDYCANHYSIRLSHTQLNMGSEQFQQIGDDYLASAKYEDFESEAAQIVEGEDMTDEQYARMLKDPNIPEMISKELEGNTCYWDEYWQAVDNVVHTLIPKYQDPAQPDGDAGGVC